MRKRIRASLAENILYRMQNKGEKTMFEDITTIFNRSISEVANS